MQVFKRADANAIDLIAKLLEYTPTQRLSSIEAMVHPFFDEIRNPTTRLPDSRHPGGQSRELPPLFNFTHHGKGHYSLQSIVLTMSTELSIAPHLNQQLVPQHMRSVLASQSKELDIDSSNFRPLAREQMMAHLD